MASPKKRRQQAATADADKQETNSIESVEEEMNANAYELPKREEPEVVIDADFIDKLEKRSTRIMDENKENKKAKFSWDQIEAILPEDFKGLALWGIVVTACAISTVLTVQFVTEIRGDAGWITLGLGLMWELSKYTFGSIAILHPEQKMKMVLGWTTAILIFGSIAASLLYLTEMNEFVETSKMTDSVEYQDLSSERHILETQINTLLLSASEDTKRSYRRRGLETNSEIDNKRKIYKELGEDMVKLREVKIQLNTFDAVASLIIALMLEICGILAISLFAQNKEKSFV
tara:strand:- start:709 stop:1578 length:870 start_codon:yes stop_codon:yes gene_type:complete